jgi:hypothetical protein
MGRGLIDDVLLAAWLVLRRYADNGYRRRGHGHI